MIDPHHTVALVLAAGAGSRLGGVPKCLIRLGGRTLLERLLDALAALDIGDVRLVVGHHAEAIAAHVSGLPADRRPVLLRNPSPAEEPADSLRLGLRCLTAMPDRLLVLLGDLPDLGEAQIGAALEAFEARARGHHALVPQVNGQPGHPAVLDGLACALLRNQHGGLRAWRRSQPEAVALWNTEDEAHVRDIDTPEDLAQLAQRSGLPVEMPLAVPAEAPAERPAPQPLPQCGMNGG